MPSKRLFRSKRGAMSPPADTRNEAGGIAYQLSPRHALAQYAATGCLGHTYYATDEQQLERLLALSVEVDAEFVAKTAVYASKRAGMKDTPALLLAALANRHTDDARFWLERAFPVAIDTGKRLRGFVQIVRSGATGRKSMATVPTRLVQKWLAARSPGQIFWGSVGNDPSMGDVINLVHPKPDSPEREALYGWLIGKTVDIERLPEQVRAYEKFKRTKPDDRSLPDGTPFEMLMNAGLSPIEWKVLAMQASWHQIRMNLNLFARHGVLEDMNVVEHLAGKLGGDKAIEQARPMPYQILATHTFIQNVPEPIRNALARAMNHALGNTPTLEGIVHVLVDVSSSMDAPVTGYRGSASSKMSCMEVAALFAAAILRKNPMARIIPFADEVRAARIRPGASVFDVVDEIKRISGGGTDCSAPLKLLNREKAQGDTVVYVSDNQSWMDSQFAAFGTKTQNEWQAFLARNPNAKTVCIDLQPNESTQVKERANVLNVGGFSDAVFDVVSLFLRGELNPDHWVGEIQSVKI